MTKANAEQRNQTWFALIDAESCRLLCCRMTKRRTLSVEEFDAITNTLPEQEHARPMTGGGATQNVENKERLFAGEIAAWLRKKANQYEIDHLVIFAPPRMLGVLRKIPLGSLRGRVEELKGDLMRLTAGQLASHPMILELVSPHRCDEAETLESKPMSLPRGGVRGPTGSARREVYDGAMSCLHVVSAFCE